MNHKCWNWFNTCHIQMGDIIPLGSGGAAAAELPGVCRLYRCVPSLSVWQAERLSLLCEWTSP